VVEPYAWPSAELVVRLLTKAVGDGVRLEEEGGVTYATSSSGSGRYRVDEHGCACKAGENGLWCKHRALYIVSNLETMVKRYGMPPWEGVE
jgi:hypothetical protein